MFGQRLHIMHRSLDVPPGFPVPGFRQRSHGGDSHFLQQRDLIYPPDNFRFQKFVPLIERILRLFQLRVGMDPRQQQGGGSTAW